MVDFNCSLYFFIVFLIQFHMNLMSHNGRDGPKSRTHIIIYGAPTYPQLVSKCDCSRKAYSLVRYLENLDSISIWVHMHLLIKIFFHLKPIMFYYVFSSKCPFKVWLPLRWLFSGMLSILRECISIFELRIAHFLFLMKCKKLQNLRL
jgi:hypothetical protein